MQNKKNDPLDFRNALGQFATGVTVVTALDNHAEPVGMTATSFNSVSLDPPLVLWSIGKSASNYDAFVNAGYFAIHVLSADQEALSGQFSRQEKDRFNELVCSAGINDVPILPHFSACFQCSTAHRYDGGDHTILVGHVDEFLDNNRRPLVFYRGRYAGLA